MDLVSIKMLQNKTWKPESYLLEKKKCKYIEADQVTPDCSRKKSRKSKKTKLESINNRLNDKNVRNKKN